MNSQTPKQTAPEQAHAPSCPWLKRFTALLCLLTLLLIFLGGQVKSHEAGLAVPDWPLTYGENPITYPVSNWVGGIYHEHFHRLWAGGVAVMTIILACWLWVRKPRPGAALLGFCAVGAVLFQAVLGGITVLLHLPVWASSAHAVLAQTFFLITVALVYLLSKEWGGRLARLDAGGAEPPTPVFKGALLLLFLVYAQLFIGALMRHTESGLAIPDFPTVAGRLVPAFNAETLAWINAWRFDYSLSNSAGRDLPDVTMGQVLIHFAHRVVAFQIFAVTSAMTLLSFVLRGAHPSALRTMLWLWGLVLVQAGLGAASIWTARTPIVASLHVMAGAAMLGAVGILVLRTWALGASQSEAVARQGAPAPAVST